jgi:uncharacterized protein YjiS (DUF1127 family)
MWVPFGERGGEREEPGRGPRVWRKLENARFAWARPARTRQLERLGLSASIPMKEASFSRQRRSLARLRRSLADQRRSRPPTG